MTKRSDNDSDSCPVPTLLHKKSKGEKHVSFPPDEDIVSGFAEHRDLGRDVDSLTLAEVILAYKKSCERHQVEPNPKIVEQLELATCVKGTLRCLDLEGERLESSSCESLEILLKSLHFDFINLRATKLEENGASSLLDMILYYEPTTHLDISDNTSMGISGWRALSHLIKQSGCLLRLDACKVSMQGYPAQALAKALPSSRLAVLSLHGCYLSGRPLFTLVGALKTNRGLQELYLASNKLNSYQDSMQLGDLLRYNSTLRVLDLGANAIADAGLEEICEGLKMQTAGLRVLMLNSNMITYNGLVYLAKVLPVLKTLEILNLGENKLQNRGIHTLKEPLIMNQSLLHLALEQTHITCEGAVALAEFIAESRQIQHLDLRENEVRAGGLMALSLALRINSSVTTLQLDHKEEQEEFLMETQERLLGEISDLCVANAGKAGIAAATDQRPTLRKPGPEEATT
ncbi:protein phosphatase 1 regulatory subunit 37 [Hypomesus transpacificus]|uniref:protein phosphatase 1 regulatory subunit 37 n=1 Tax=Hypomesus transpacificus TaxID=137520 RepID=UPI001F079B4C|nr:protein phosphatase 1 regulatory subunit 37 [Hypomesus transpacificus]